MICTVGVSVASCRGGLVRRMALLGVLCIPTASATAQDSPATRRALEAMQLHAYEDLGYVKEQVEAESNRRESGWLPYCLSQRQALALQRATAEKPTETLRVECEEMLAGVPRFENPSDYGILQQRFEQIHSVAASFDRSLPYRPLLGTVARGDVNARTTNDPGYILVVDDGAWRTAWTLSKILAWSLPTLDNASARKPFDVDWPEVLSHLRADPEPTRRFRELLDAIVTRKHPYFGPRNLMDRDEEKKALGFVNALNTALELFIVGHEYAHLADGHLDRKIRGRPIQEYSKEPIRLGIRTLPFNRFFKEEFDADQLGLDMASEALKGLGVNTELSILGAVLCIRAIEILDGARGVGRAKLRSGSLGGLADCESQPSTDREHPPTSCRVWMLKLHARQQPEVLRKVELLESILDHFCSEVALAAQPGGRGR